MTEPNSQPHSKAREFLLPEVHKEVVLLFRKNLPDFEVLYDQLKHTNPLVADYIRDRAEQLAPGNIAYKEVLARLALETHGILTAQTEVNAIEELFADQEPDTPAA